MDCINNANDDKLVNKSSSAFAMSTGEIVDDLPDVHCRIETARREAVLSETLVSNALDSLLSELTEKHTVPLERRDSKDSCAVEVGDDDQETEEPEVDNAVQLETAKPAAEEEKVDVVVVNEDSTTSTLYDEALGLVGKQTQLLAFWKDLSDDEKNSFVAQLRKTNFADCAKWFVESADVEAPQAANLKPIPAEKDARKADFTKEQIEEFKMKGLEAIADGQVAAIVLAGGQASRLGSNVPKGTLELGIGCAFGDSLLGIQCAKIVALQTMATRQFPEKNGKIHWIVMTSPGTDELTKKHLRKLFVMHNLSTDQLTMICQDEIPAYNMDGDLLLAPNKCSLVTAPNGNGGLFPALYPELKRLETMGIRYTHVYCVDNILCKVADPVFMGFAISKNADVVTKTVVKKQGELVGSVCLNNDKACIVEYSELGPELAEQKTEDGRYLFGAGSIANHFFTLEFLKIVSGAKPLLPFHRALKKISHVASNGEVVKPQAPNGIKLEQFVFDVFQCASNFYTWEVSRSDEFSPLKNAESAGKECLSTCKADLAAQNRTWLAAVGITYPDDVQFFFKTLQSYDGEGLMPLRVTPQALRIKGVVVDDCRNYLPKRELKILKIEKPKEEGEEEEPEKKDEEVF